MVKMYYDQDANLELLADKVIAVLGAWKPGPCAQAQNLKDSGLNVIISLREGSRSAETARSRWF